MPNEAEAKVAAHTPGPWNEHEHYPLNSEVRHVTDGDFDYWTGRIAKGDMLIGEVHYQSATGGWPHVEDIDEARANARLIIAAPELLAALKEVVGCEYLHDYQRELIASAIAKAEGR